MRNVLIGIFVGLLAVFGYYALTHLFKAGEKNQIETVAEKKITEEPAAKTVEKESPPPKVAANDETAFFEKTFPVVGSPLLPAKGTVRILPSRGGLIVRYENLDATNGPSLYIYASPGKTLEGAVQIAPVTAVKGNVNYDLPGALDLSKYPYILMWSKELNVLYNYAKIEVE